MKSRNTLTGIGDRCEEDVYPKDDRFGGEAGSTAYAVFACEAREAIHSNALACIDGVGS